MKGITFVNGVTFVNVTRHLMLYRFFTDDSPSKVPVEGKRTSTSKLHHLSQVVATVIAFSFVQNSHHSSVTKVPTVRIHPNGFEVLIYDCKNDTLFTAGFGWGENEIPILWAVLNYKEFLDMELQLEHKSGYIAFANLNKAGFPYVDTGEYQYLVNIKDFSSESLDDDFQSICIPSGLFVKTTSGELVKRFKKT